MPILNQLNILSLAGVEPYIEAPNEPYLGDAQKAHFKRLLLGWKQAVEANLKSQEGGISLGENSVNLPDPVDRAAQEEALVLDVRTKDRQINLVRQIINALQRLEAEEFGYCQSCDEAIGLKRLEASPTTRLCIDCQQLAELQNKQLNLFQDR